MSRKDSRGREYDAWGIMQPWDKVPHADTVRPTRSESIAAFEKLVGQPWAVCREEYAARFVKIRFVVVGDE